MARRPPDTTPQRGLGGTLLSLLLLTNLFIAVNAQQQPKQQHDTQHHNTPHLNTDPEAANLDTRDLIPYAPDVRVSRDAVRAPATLFPVDRTVGGLASRLPARSLQDWKIEDVVLLATVDGTIHARSRNTGGKLWEWSSETPMVETTHHRRNRSIDGRGLANADDDLLYIVEPSENGELYSYTPGSRYGLKKLGVTVKQLVDDWSGLVLDELPIVYNGEKSTSTLQIDIKTGKVTFFGNARQSSLTDEGVCRQVSELDSLDDDKCGATATLTLTRTEYIVGVQSKATGEQISTIRFSEWGPNKRDYDLFAQYSSTMDNKYIHSRHNGEILALESSGSPESDKRMYRHKLESPVARVFDVARPLNSDALDTPLVLLPQPLNPSFNGENSNVFVNCTEDGSWYAMSESTYPLVTRGADEAQCAQWEWKNFDVKKSPSLLESQLRDALVGVHSFTGQQPSSRDVPLLPGGGPNPPTLNGRQNTSPLLNSPGEVPSAPGISKVQSTPFGYSLATLLLFFAIIGLGTFRRNITRAFIKGSDIQKAAPLLAQETSLQPETPGEVPVVDVGAKSQVDSQAEPLTVGDVEIATTPNVVNPAEPSPEAVEDAEQAEETPAKKKKAHRGKRGGVRLKEKKGLLRKPFDDDEDDAVETVKPDIVYHGGKTPAAEPAGLLNLNIHKDQLLGQGSGGTIVFAGTFEGRDVAVKRMLGQYSALAEQEVELLGRAENHPNVIRYFCTRKDENFLYIALELCQASLFDLFRDGRPEEVPEKYNELVGDIRMRPDKVLRQLAAGLEYLHKLRIVHRDIKPQNMLISYPRFRTNQDFPRLVISDFGLCKTLPENASTLIGATFSAGTTGWKAPELIFQPKDIANGSSHSTSKESSNGLDSVHGVKRAVDIFSLGCVFYYILTQGHHPFDDDEGWMGIRERNIKANRCNMSELDIRVPDELVADAKDLISWMLQPRPEDRPTASEVLTHPFFWTKEDRLAFLSLASDRFDLEARDGTSPALHELECEAEGIIGKGPKTVTYSAGQSWDTVGLPGEPNFLAKLDQKFIDTLGKQRKYQGHKLVDLLRALRNKLHHWDDMPDDVKRLVGSLPEGYLHYWEKRFPGLVVGVWRVTRTIGYSQDRRFARWFQPELVGN